MREFIQNDKRLSIASFWSSMQISARNHPEIPTCDRKFYRLSSTFQLELSLILLVWSHWKCSLFRKLYKSMYWSESNNTVGILESHNYSGWSATIMLIAWCRTATNRPRESEMISDSSELSSLGADNIVMCGGFTECARMTQLLTDICFVKCIRWWSDTHQVNFDLPKCRRECRLQLIKPPLVLPGVSANLDNRWWADSFPHTVW
jgi:hypothetical protein